MRLPLVFLLLVFQTAGLRAASVEEISRLAGEGHWRQAQREITEELAQPGISFQTRQDLLFQSDRMERMQLDFDKTREQVFQQARAIVPAITEEQFAGWEKAGAVEFMDIDGTRWYYHNAAANLFRINPEARALKAKLHPETADQSLYRLADVRNIIANYEKTGERLNSPRTWRVTYGLSVKPGAVPPGEIIRAWLPFPQAGNRQSNVRLVSADPPRFLLLDTNAALASVYLEKPAASNGPTEFKIVFEYTSDAFCQPIDPARVLPADANDPALAPFLGEQPPNIVFSDEIKNLSREIVGDETNPYLNARKIFAWVYQHIPWTTAREYSTIECLPRYALGCGHGDCGIKTMTFMTLCRFNGIPARWESGWTTDPVKDMHDWCEIYLAPYGWVPADVTYGVVKSADQREKWFFLGGIDAGRLVANTDYAQPLYPAKTFFRSEIVDFQRGEVEWRGGNLYFNQWNYDFKVEEIPPRTTLMRNVQ
ncbi:MAG TPA: transglutaminase domain-containing protein [Candidatus Nitrosopolaris sp.]|nr:transglutaminase domain-containing protein [Candidatus Nitrosopolaris sp.]